MKREYAMKKIEFLYFEGCPSYKKALENLRAALAEDNIEAEIKLIRVDSPEKAEALGFYGSPSIRVDGVDLEGKRGEYNYSCRIYEIKGQSTGVPTKEYIREKLFASTIPH
jgi:hypothetical protein